VKPEIILGNSGSTYRYPNNPYPNICRGPMSQIITCWQLAGPGGQAHPRHGPRSITPSPGGSMPPSRRQSRSSRTYSLTDVTQHAPSPELQPPGGAARHLHSPATPAAAKRPSLQGSSLQRPRRRRRPAPAIHRPAPAIQAEPGSQARRRPGRSRTPSCSCHPG
jgi:hypothetical protein